MKRHSKGSVLDLSIRGDELENHRIRLENNLQHTAADLSFKLSSVSDDEAEYHNHSIEYPRHNSGPVMYPDFASFEHTSRDHFDGDTHSQIHPYSFRTDDDEGGIYPYAGGETMSTAAHHASALTLSAGLGGGRGRRRDISLSGAEYDADRPLQDMIAGVDSKLSVFDIEPSRSRYPGVNSVAFEPLVVDSTATLDRVLQSGHTLPPNHMRIQSPLSASASSSSDSEPNRDNHTARPKLSDSLRKNVTFSPKRPRSAQSNRPELPRHQPLSKSPLSQARNRPLQNGSPGGSAGEPQNTVIPTPKPKKRTSIFPSHPASSSPASALAQQPQLRLQPATPSSAGSHFSRMARGLTKEIRHEQAHVHAESSKNASTSGRAQIPNIGKDRNMSVPGLGTDRNPFEVADASASVKQPTPKKASALKQTPRARVYLPDVTGLTSAVESPAKMGIEYDYYRYQADGSPREIEARLIMTLNTVQSKLLRLEEENGISRRRVRELEMELEVCKRDVARERTRVLEREEIIVQQQREVKRHSNGKGKSRARDVSINVSLDKDRDHELVRERYKEAVEEKKALEALITTLRTHLSRLTRELSSHKELLTSLRELRDSDVRALKRKGEEIERLREEVERLAGEVEVLRGVVEEGLKERRGGRDVEASVPGEEQDLGMSEDIEEHEGDDQEHEREESVEGSMVRREDRNVLMDHDQGQEGYPEEPQKDEEAEPSDLVSIRGSSRSAIEGLGSAEKTMRTDYATAGSSKLGQSAISTSGFMDSGEFERISAEVEERRLERSRSGSTAELSDSSHRSLHSRSPMPVPGRRANVKDVILDEENDEDGSRGASPPPSPHNSDGFSQRNGPFQPTASSRPPVPTLARTHSSTRHVRGQRPSHVNTGRISEVPFPQIRGTHLERLFFSAPEHNARTCNVCRRRGVGDGDKEQSWIPSRFRQRGGNGHLLDKNPDEEADEGEDEDEGFTEGSEQHQYDHDRRQQERKRGEHVTFSDPVAQGPGASHWREQADRQGIPPQTVVARVIRELEDDFTHYKGIYVELADQYKFMDAVSDVPKRNILAKHLREVVDILEQKGDQIASLYDLLTFKDKPVAESVVPTSTNKMRSGSIAGMASSSISRKPGIGIR